MNYLVQVKIYKGEGDQERLITNKARLYPSQTQVNAQGLKKLIKDKELDEKLKACEMLKEECWHGNVALADSDLVSEVSGLEIDLYLK